MTINKVTDSIGRIVKEINDMTEKELETDFLKTVYGVYLTDGGGIVEHDSIDVYGHRLVVIFTPLGHRCGYVGVYENSPLRNVEYNDLDVNVHGGLTFSGNLNADDSQWFFGFDCAHIFDSPDIEQQKKYIEMGLMSESQYDLLNVYLISHFLPKEKSVKSLDFVLEELKNLSVQLIDMELERND
jgi:hypothetical protein